jgi:predicted RNA binding protein YcfA (HicA-like mRNA interferase family)
MKLPRDVSGDDLARRLTSLGYRITRQTGSHMRLTLLSEEHGEHHVTVPRHSPLRVGTFSSILTDVARHLGMSRDKLVETLFR